MLSREITDEESTILKEAGCSTAVFGTDSLPTNADTIVTKLDVDDTISPTLAEAIESALEAVKKVPDLSVPGLTVPAQPAGPSDEEPKVVTGEMVEEVAAEVIEESPATKATSKKATPKKASSARVGTRKKVEVSAKAE
ncbi:MAG TPA: hypothetical protein VF070_48955 [Streptosporangiaceae bacterium]